MSQYPISFLAGNPTGDSAEILESFRDDAAVRAAALLDSPNLKMEMAAAFGWDEPPTDEQAEADYAAERCDEEELLAMYPGLRDRPDAELIEMIADPLPFGDADEAAAAAAIILARRLSGHERSIG